MKLNALLARGAAAALACALLAGCGGQTVSPSVPEDQTPSSVVSSQEAQPTPEPTAAPAAQGALELTERESALGSYELFTMFSNGYAWVWANGEAGYLSEDGQYTPLYSIPREDIFNIDVEQMTTDGFTLQQNVEKLSELYSCPERRHRAFLQGWPVGLLRPFRQCAGAAGLHPHLAHGPAGLGRPGG